MSLTRNNFKGINNDTLIRYIGLINDKLDANLKESISWPTNMTSLRNFLNEHDFIEHEGSRINKKSINAFIKRLIPPITPSITPPIKDIDEQPLMQQPSSKTPLSTSDKTLSDNSNNNNSPKTNFLPKNKLLMSNRRQKVVRYAQPGDLNSWKSEYPSMYSLGDVVLNKKKDFHLVRNAVNLNGAQKWAAKHKYPVPQSDVDINGDNIPDTVVYDNYGKPVMVNGWTLTRSKYPLRKEFLDEYPTREEQHAAGGYSKFVHDFEGRQNENGEYVYFDFADTWNKNGYKFSESGYRIFGRFVTDYVKKYVKNLLDPQIVQDKQLFGAVNMCIPYATIISSHWVNLLGKLWNKPVPEIRDVISSISRKTSDPMERYKKFKSKMQTKKYEKGFANWIKQNYAINLNSRDVSIELSNFGINQDSINSLAIGTFNQNRDNNGKVDQEVVKTIRRQINEAATNAKNNLIHDFFSGNSLPPQAGTSVEHAQSHLNQDFPPLPEDDSAFFE